MLKQGIVKICIPLLEEGTDTWKETDAIDNGNGTYWVIQPDDYDPEDEIWEFPPGTTVRCEIKESYDGKKLLVAVERMS